MDNIKISLTFSLQGRKRVTQGQCEKHPKIYAVEETIKFTEFDKKTKKPYTKTIVIQLCKDIPAKQTINLSLEAYNGFIETPIKPYKQKVWNSLPIKERIRLHCNHYAEAMQGKLLEYHIFED